MLPKQNSEINEASKGLSKLKIEIDGGVSISNAPDLIHAGANVLVAGNFVFSSPNPIDTIANLVKLGN